MLKDFFRLFYPNLCIICNDVLLKSENPVCLRCSLALPYTNYHFTPDNNPVAKVFWGRIPILQAMAFLHFRKGNMVQELVHRLKYKNEPYIGDFLGRIYGKSLLDSQTFSKPDYIIPVPLHPAKEKIRGYNQSFHYAAGLADALKSKASDSILARNKSTSTQTNKSRFDRWTNVNSIFIPGKDFYKIENSHVLLVDDIVTTGATLEACADVLIQYGKARVSVASIAFTN